MFQEPTMHALVLILTILPAVILLAIVVVLRGKTDGRWGVELADIAIALTPIFVWLVLTGQLAKLTFGGEGFSVELQKVLITNIANTFAHFSLPIESLSEQETESVTT